MIVQDEFSQNFPPDAHIPLPLLKLLEYQNQVNDWYSGHFELTAYGRDDTIAWFDGDQEAAYQFVPFGTGPDGSSYCFWLNDGRDLEHAPVVFLGSEGVNNTVLANGVEEFLALLGVGYDELGFANWSEGPEEEAENLRRFRAWLEKECGIRPPERGLEIISRAKAEHPDLDEWIKNWRQGHFGT